MILFFEVLLQRVAATAFFRNLFKALLWRKKRKQLPIYEIIEKRAANCIQAHWSNWKMKKRMHALSNIKQHIDQIQDNRIYVEQSIYQNLNEIAAQVHSQYRFMEQSIMFDFNPHTYQIYMQVQENIPMDGSVPSRYSRTSVPQWFQLPLRTPDFIQTSNVNNLLALFHFNVGDCRVVPATHIIDYQKQQIDVDKSCYYIEISTSSVEEAKKRALVLAYLTYDVRTHNFVRLNTRSMMENPHIMSKMYKVFEKFSVEVIDKQEGIDLKTLVG